MSFAENLKTLRKEKQLSQEDLAELMGVSRQAVSKWEQGSGYPEMEKLLLLSKKLNVSLDYLLLEERMAIHSEDEAEERRNILEKNTMETDKEAQTDKEVQQVVNRSGTITIKSYDDRTIMNCYKVYASKVLYKPREDEPKFWLLGVNNGDFWGEKTEVLGWYEKEEDIQKEMKAIGNAINQGIAVYELQYAVKVKNKRLRVKIEKSE
ncbi:helix-turn-helix domain-containing protein [Anaerosporobacter faecicola]|uniref:helix-turn-helix domain-containing protein n=1 Tax=Anaerosporobacter faecicola TaxID=2718714 RepID=UPI00143A5DAC|nr:helix-turn-helix transcriptional regulator [Anaerosporobacter faecicola]